MLSGQDGHRHHGHLGDDNWTEEDVVERTETQNRWVKAGLYPVFRCHIPKVICLYLSVE